MIERVLENWLDNASERTFQIPFCHILQAEGYTILHMTRHCAMEIGKDIIALDSDGIPCAFQLKGSKGKKISLSHWREDISSQISDLMTCKISHPSIDQAKPHRSFFVTNGELEEEVCRAISDLNGHWIDLGYPQNRLETIVRGQLLEKAKQIGLNLWPTELVDTKTFLEIYLCDGRGSIPKEKLASLFWSTLSPKERSDQKKLSKSQIIRNISSCSLLCASAISSYSNCNNYFAEIEAWTIFLSYVFACIEKWSLDENEVEGSINIAKDTIYNALGLLCDELQNRQHFVEGDAMSDKPLYKVRMTQLVACMSIYGLWRKEKKEMYNEQDHYIKEFCTNNIKNLVFWGEKAYPQFLAFFWYYSTFEVTPKPAFLLREIIHLITKINHPESKAYIANPYYDENKILPHMLGIASDKLNEEFQGVSFAIEGLTHLFARRNWKQEIKLLWPDITRIGCRSFFPEEVWQYYLWRSERGTNETRYPPYTKEWRSLKEDSNECAGESIPYLLKKHYAFFMLFLIVYPHRARADAVRWLDTRLSL